MFQPEELESDEPLFWSRPNLPDDPPRAAPLAWAKRRGHAEIVDLIQRAGAA